MKSKVGICLSGGGARGIAHIGVLQYLKEQNIHPGVISGTSAGSIIGALYAAGLTPMEMMDVVKAARMWRVYRFRNPFRGLTDLTYLRKIILDAIQVDNFAALQKKLIISVSNFNTGKLEYISEGPLLEVVSAACSVPGVFHSVEMRGSLYADGGIMDNMPAWPLKQEAEFIIGVDLVPVIEKPDRKVKYLRGLAIRSFEMMIHANTKSNIPFCDIYIAPEELAHYSMASIRPADALFEIGYQAAKNSGVVQKLNIS